jgi:hypothetical protein
VRWCRSSLHFRRKPSKQTSRKLLNQNRTGIIIALESSIAEVVEAESSSRRSSGMIFLRIAVPLDLLFEHDLFGKPVPASPDHALAAAQGIR